MRLHAEATANASMACGAGRGSGSAELAPALHGLLETFVAPGSRCLNVGRGGGGAIGGWLLDRGCDHIQVPVWQATVLPQADATVDAAFLIGVLDQLRQRRWAATELPGAAARWRPAGHRHQPRLLAPPAQPIGRPRRRVVDGRRPRLPAKPAALQRLQPGRCGRPGGSLHPRPALRRTSFQGSRLGPLPSRRALVPRAARGPHRRVRH
jgi:hypothetical protein